MLSYRNMFAVKSSVKVRMSSFELYEKPMILWESVFQNITRKEFFIKKNRNLINTVI